LDVIDTIQVDFVVVQEYKPVLCGVILQSVRLFPRPSRSILTAQVLVSDITTAEPRDDRPIHSIIKVGNQSVPEVRHKSGDHSKSLLSAFTMGSDTFLAIKKHVNTLRNVAPPTELMKDMERDAAQPTHRKKQLKRFFHRSSGDRIAKLNQITVPASTSVSESLTKFHKLVISDYDERFIRASKGKAVAKKVEMTVTPASAGPSVASQ
jgi:hypothetical protein